MRYIGNYFLFCYFPLVLTVACIGSDIVAKRVSPVGRHHRGTWLEHNPGFHPPLPLATTRNFPERPDAGELSPVHLQKGSPQGHPRRHMDIQPGTRPNNSTQP